jgi:hypothetical protein
MELTNGTSYTIEQVPVKIIGKTEGGEVIVQTHTGLQFIWDPEFFLTEMVDKD